LLVVTAAVFLAAVMPEIADSQLAASSAPTQTVAVTLREYEILLPPKLRPGSTIFVLRNRGRFPHDFTVLYGPTRFNSSEIPPGATRRLRATLVPGAYLVACTVLNGGHLAQGMYTVFTVGSRAHGSAHWHYP
jgi:hypothetical protein